MVFSSEAAACSCAAYEIEESYNEYPHVFVGTVEKIEKESAKNWHWDCDGIKWLKVFQDIKAL